MKKLFIASQYCLPQHLLSRLLGSLAECRISFLKNFLIRLFIRRYQVNMSEAQRQRPEDFSCFNDFFTRQLQAGARPLADRPNAILSPSDGNVSALGDIHKDQIFQAKGKAFTLQALLGGDAQQAALFEGGKFATLYLSPKDYHRVHMPVTGTLQAMTYIPGKLFSVNQTTAEHIDNLFARNERAVCLFQTEHGPMAVILVGALIVAGIETVWAGQVAPGPSIQRHQYQNEQAIQIAQGEELGLFKLGSTAIVLFPADLMQWSESLQTGSPTRMGESIGEFSGNL